MVSKKNALSKFQCLDFVKHFEAYCPNHGNQVFIQVFDDVPECKICQQERFDNEKKAQALASFIQIKSLAMQANGICLGKTLSNWQMDDEYFDRQKALITNLTAYANNFNEAAPNILMIGATGTGKTHLCNGVATILFDARYHHSRPVARLIKTAQITRQVKDSWSDKTKPSESQLLDELVGVELLILDDLGDGDSVSGETGINDRARFGQIIDARYQKAPTIITSNLNIQKVASYLGDRAWDRFSQTMIVVHCDWQSYRQKTRQVQTW